MLIVGLRMLCVQKVLWSHWMSTRWDSGWLTDTWWRNVSLLTYSTAHLSHASATNMAAFSSNYYHSTLKPWYYTNTGFYQGLHEFALPDNDNPTTSWRQNLLTLFFVTLWWGDLCLEVYFFMWSVYRLNASDVLICSSKHNNFMSQFLCFFCCNLIYHWYSTQWVIS